MTTTRAGSFKGVSVPVLAIDGGKPVAEKPIPIVSVALDEADIAAAVAVLRSGRLAQGAKALEFEERFARASGARHAVACANGTCALQLAYEPLFGPGDDVLVPAWTYVATASMVAARGARPVFCDADPATYTIDVADAARRITPKTRAIAVTHLYGAPADIDAVQRLGEKHGLKIIYDAAQAHLSTWRGQGVGAFGDAVTNSFYPTKNLTTGEGGMVTTNDDTFARDLRLLRSHGETQKYLHERIGYNYRMTDVEAAIGCSQMDRLERLTARRRQIAGALDRALANVPGLAAPTTPPGAGHAYHLYAVRTDERAFRVDRDAFCKALNAEGVGTAIHYPRPAHRQPAFARFNPGEAPVADRLARTLFCIPVHPALTDHEVDLVGEALRKVAGAYRA